MKHLLLISLFAISHFTFAQQEQISIRLSGGRAFAQGDFKDNSNSYYSGFAKNGVIGRFGLGFPISNSVQIDFDASRASYKVDEKAYSAIFRSILEQQLPGSSKNSEVSIGKYINTNAFGSVRLSLNKDRASLYLKPGVGISWFKVPTVSAFAEVGNNSVTSTATYETAVSLMLNLSAGLQAELAENVFFDLNVQYLRSEFETEATVYTIDQNGNSANLNARENPRFASLNVTIGLVFYINKGGAE